jgi:hypothetical protein
MVSAFPALVLNCALAPDPEFRPDEQPATTISTVAAATGQFLLDAMQLT